jgi:hypothetical protein
MISYVTLPGTYRVSDEAPVPNAEAIAAWALVAREELQRTAGNYHATITYSELAEAVQVGTGIRTKRLLQHWIGHVLGAVAASCHGKSEPLLSSLCVNAEGSVGPGYEVALLQTYGPPAPQDLDRHAAEERLQCHRYFGAEMPTAGGVAALTPKLAQQRARARQKQLAEAPRDVCPNCFQVKLSIPP